MSMLVPFTQTMNPAFEGKMVYINISRIEYIREHINNTTMICFAGDADQFIIVDEHIGNVITKIRQELSNEE